MVVGPPGRLLLGWDTGPEVTGCEPGGERRPPGGPPPGGARLLLSACLRGRQTGQSCRLQCFQWAMICRLEEQWATGQVLPA